MFPLLKLLNKDLINEIYLYNNYSKLDMEWFEFLHREKYYKVMENLEHHFLYPKLKKMWLDHMVESIIEEL